MTVPFSPEQHLDAVVAFLRTSFPAYMAAEDVSHADGLTLGQLTSGNVIPGGRWPIATLAPDAPAIEVAIPDQTLDNVSLGGTDADELLVLAIRAWQQQYGDPDSAVEQLYRKSLRMGNALALALMPAANDAFGNGSVVQQWRSSWRVDPTTDQRESWTSSLVVVLQVVADATYV